MDVLLGMHGHTAPVAITVLLIFFLLYVSVFLSFVCGGSTL